MPLSVQIILVISAIAGLAYTVGKAFSSVQKQDLDKLEASQKRDLDQVEKRLTASIGEVKSAQKESANKFEATQKENANKLEGRIDTSISALNAKFDRYLFGKLDKTKTDDSSDDSPDSRN